MAPRTLTNSLLLLSVMSSMSKSSPVKVNARSRIANVRSVFLVDRLEDSGGWNGSSVSGSTPPLFVIRLVRSLRMLCICVVCVVVGLDRPMA